MYRVRVLARDGEAAAEARDVGAVVKERLLTARDARRAIGIPNADTDTYRYVRVCVMLWHCRSAIGVALHEDSSLHCGVASKCGGFSCCFTF